MAVEEDLISDRVRLSFREGLLKVDLGMNMSFPQIGLGINAGSVAYYLLNQGELRELSGPLSPEEIDRAYEVMARAHASHDRAFRTRAEADFGLNAILGIAYSLLPSMIVRTLEFFIDFRKIPAGTDEDKINYFYTSGNFTPEIEKSKRYAQTVMKALRSPEAMGLSKEYRMSIKERRHSRTEIRAGLEEIVVKYLLRNHPELGIGITQRQHENYKEPKKLAVIFWRLISGQSVVLDSNEIL